MKELLYIQAGPFSNYIGTHFWNTQQEYYDREEKVPDYQGISHERSFVAKDDKQVHSIIFCSFYTNALTGKSALLSKTLDI